MADASTLNKSANGGIKRPSAEDKPSLHIGRTLCYYFKKEHTYLRDQVAQGSIRFDTPLEIDVEMCTAERPAMSLRASVKSHGDPPYNRYASNWDQLVAAVEESLMQNDAGAKMWAVAMSLNDRKKTLGPRNAAENLRKPRLGSFEIVLSWRSSEKSSRQEVVLFSKLNTQRFPHPRDLVAYLNYVLAPARTTKFRIIARNVPTGQAEQGCFVRAVLDSSDEEFPKDDAYRRTGAYGFIEPQLPFGYFTAFADVGHGMESKKRGMAQFEVHGELNKCICVPVGEAPVPGELRVVLTWAEFPHDVVLYVKTPEGKIWKPSAKEGSDLVCTQLPNAELECTHEEGGYGPISVLLKQLLTGRYHVFARCSPYRWGNRDVGWAHSNAQVSFFGHEHEPLNWVGPTHFTHPKEGESDWWDVCFLDVNASGGVTVKTFNVLVNEEPGNRQATITARDLHGNPVPGVKVVCQADSHGGGGAGESQEPGDTDDNGQLVVTLPLAQYTVKVEKAGYISAAVRLLVDLDPACPEVVVPMVKPDIFDGGRDLLCVLSWGGIDQAEMHVETPGRLLKRPIGIEAEIASCEVVPNTTMHMRGKNPKSVLLTAPSTDRTICMEGIEDRIFVNFKGGRLEEGGLETCNMQVTIFSHKDGMLYKLNPPPLPPGGAAGGGGFWEVATVENGTIRTVDNRCDVSPARGDIFTVKVLRAKDGSDKEGVAKDFPPMAQVLVKNAESERMVRRFEDAPHPGTVDFTAECEYALFLEYGKYTIEAVDDHWFSPVLAENVLFHPQTQPSLGLTMAERSDVDAKTLFVTLSWAKAPADLDLCMRSADGTVSALTNTDSKATAIKGVKYETAVSDGFGPKTISMAQPISGKFKIYVLNRDPKGERVSFFKCNPVITIVIFTGVWKQYQLKRGDNYEDALAEHTSGPLCWHVCDLKIESDSKMSDQCIECMEINRLQTIEPGNDGA